ncbi:hypothetical protein HPB50_002046 [Hyalomma asiaticum]|uniref:Uncharacterized protein n=1 Tax=Hyalomma asiaticum TaxID=266040 RepID=A0ACB7TD24_HYAAI|nr:hypothetical protein HPB50_002046 [Hyalomma asiaticum]
MHASSFDSRAQTGRLGEFDKAYLKPVETMRLHPAPCTVQQSGGYTTEAVSICAPTPTNPNYRARMLYFGSIAYRASAAAPL